MVVDDIDFAGMLGHFKGKNFRNPTLLSVRERPISKILLIGSCTVVPLPVAMGVSCDNIVYNGGVLPALPVGNKYDLQVWQIPIRSLLDYPAILHTPFADVFAYEKLFRSSILRLRQALSRFADTHRAPDVPVFVYNFLVPTINPCGRLQRTRMLANPQYFVSELNRELELICQDMSNVFVVDINEIANTIGKQYFSDEFADWYAHGSVHLFENNEALGKNDGLSGARMEKTPHMVEHYVLLDPKVFHEAVAAEIKSMFRAYHGDDAIKMVVVDLDDTLWKGVLGDKEDPADHSHPYSRGKLSAMAEGWPRGVAEALLYLKRRGLILGIISRNDEKVVADRFSEIFDGEIQLNDFAVRYINFDDKPENMARLLQAVNLLPESMIFVDDNPVDRARMSAAFPGMRVFGRYFLWHRHLLLNAAETQVRVITQESASRSEFAARQAEREALREGISSQEFLASLGVQASSALLVAGETPADRIDRCVELTNKTNQWNSTGERTSQDKVAALLGDGANIFCFSAADKFAVYGDICFVTIRNKSIEQFVMSCRVAGLGLESAFLLHIMDKLQVDSIDLSYSRTEKNSPFRLFAERFAFEEGLFKVRRSQLEPCTHVTFR